MKGKKRSTIKQPTLTKKIKKEFKINPEPKTIKKDSALKKRNEQESLRLNNLTMSDDEFEDNRESKPVIEKSTWEKHTRTVGIHKVEIQKVASEEEPTTKEEQQVVEKETAPPEKESPDKVTLKEEIIENSAESRADTIVVKRYAIINNQEIFK